MKNMKVGYGTLSFGLILLGVLLLLQISEVITFDVLKYFAPILLIMFGIEIVMRYTLHSNNTERKMNFSVWAVILISLVLVYSVIESIFPQTFVLKPKYLSSVSDQIVISSDINQVNISIPEGKINIIGGSGQELSYSGELKTAAGSQAEADQIINDQWKVQKRGDTLELTLELPMQFSLFDFSFKNAYLNIHLPAHLMTSVTTKNSSIHVEKMAADTALSTSNGKMTVEDIRGNVLIKTSNGTITATEIDGELQATTSNGAIVLTDISGKVIAKSSNGAITASSEIHGEWDLSTSNGRINMSLPTHTNAQIHARTSNGNFSGNIAWQGNDKRNRSSTIGTGEYNVQLHTSNGNIEVNYR